MAEAPLTPLPMEAHLVQAVRRLERARAAVERALVLCEWAPADMAGIGRELQELHESARAASELYHAYHAVKTCEGRA